MTGGSPRGWSRLCRAAFLTLTSVATVTAVTALAAVTSLCMSCCGLPETWCKGWCSHRKHVNRSPQNIALCTGSRLHKPPQASTSNLKHKSGMFGFQCLPNFVFPEKHAAITDRAIRVSRQQYHVIVQVFFCCFCGCTAAPVCTPDFRGIGWCEYGASGCLIPSWRRSATDILQCTNPNSESVCAKCGCSV